MKLNHYSWALLILCFFITSFINAQAPQGINYQAVVRNSSGNIISNTTVGLKVSIRQGSPTGTVVYAESFTPTTTNIGLVNLVIGQGNVLSGSFSSITWSTGTYYCELGLDITGGTSYTTMGTQQFVSVPYALYAETSGNSGTNYTAGTGINITGTVISNTGDTNAGDDITTSTTAGGDLTGTYPNPSLINTGVTANTYGSASLIPVLTIDSKGRITAATTVANTGTAYTAGTGINITGTVISNTGDANGSDDITTSTTAGGDLTGTYPNPSLINTGVAANTYGSATQIPVITVDAKGRLTNVTLATVSAGGGGGTLDAAYDFGGAGAGRTITVDAGSVTLNSSSSAEALIINSSGTNSTGVRSNNTGTGVCFRAESTNPANTFAAIQSNTNSTTTTNSAILGNNSGAGYGVAGQIPGTATGSSAVYGNNLRTTGGIGTEGVGFNGVAGSSAYNQGFGVFGSNSSTPNIPGGMYSVGVAGISINGIGMQGQTTNGQAYGILGQNLNTGVTYNNTAIYGLSSTGVGVLGECQNLGYYGVFSNGDFGASGTKAFVIDHPSDPSNKYLKHFSIESDEVLNVYRGTVTCDANGEAIVTLPDYVELVNINYTYQLTTIGGYAPVYIKTKVSNGTFTVAGGTPGMEVSWQLTGERNDPYLQQHPEKRDVVIEKREGERGTYLIPELYNQPVDKKLHHVNNSLQKLQQ